MSTLEQPADVLPFERRACEIHNKYKTTLILGQGTYGIVYKAENVDGKSKIPSGCKYVALKRVDLQNALTFGIPETALREVTLLQDLQHDNLLPVYDVWCNTNRLYMVCEYMDGDLKQYVNTMNRLIPVHEVKLLAFKVLRAVVYCHSHRVMHRDLKPHNILISQDLSEVKLGDFGLARSNHAPEKTLTHEVVTLWYRAPEILLGDCTYDNSVDVWSLGCIIAELLLGCPLFPGDSEIDTLFRIFRLLGTPSQNDWPSEAMQDSLNFPQFPPTYPILPETSRMNASCVDMLSRMLQVIPCNRARAIDILEHEWFADIRVTQQVSKESYGHPLAAPQMVGCRRFIEQKKRARIEDKSFFNEATRRTLYPKLLPFYGKLVNNKPQLHLFPPEPVEQYEQVVPSSLSEKFTPLPTSEGCIADPRYYQFLPQPSAVYFPRRSLFTLPLNIDKPPYAEGRTVAGSVGDWRGHHRVRRHSCGPKPYLGGPPPGLSNLDMYNYQRASENHPQWHTSDNSKPVGVYRLCTQNSCTTTVTGPNSEVTNF